jgi:hypothetical protein
MFSTLRARAREFDMVHTLLVFQEERGLSNFEDSSLEASREYQAKYTMTHRFADIIYHLQVIKPVVWESVPSYPIHM